MSETSLSANEMPSSSTSRSPETVVLPVVVVRPPAPPPLPNRSLTVQEREAKRQLKKEFKQRNKWNKLHTKLQQSILRRDAHMEAVTRREMGEFSKHYESMTATTTTTTEPQEDMKRARDLIEHWYLQLEPHLRRKQQQHHQHQSKDVQTAMARSLLGHMKKGSQEASMFDQEAALLGYTRQKFQSRAWLACRSLDRSVSFLLSNNNNNNNSRGCRRIASIGCGPGCDMAGVLAFFQIRNQPVERIVLLDYVLPRWKNAVLDDLIPILLCSLASTTTTTTTTTTVEMDCCNVRHSLVSADCNRNAREGCLQDLSQLDLIVCSYLLSETHGHWTDFFRDLLEGLASGTLLLLSEPTAWQLHHFLHVFAPAIAHAEWLDSSRDTPQLQVLERRLGPAVVLVQVK